MDKSDSGTPRQPRVAVPGSEKAPVAGAQLLGKTAPTDTVRVTVVLKPKTPLSEPLGALALAGRSEGDAIERHHEAFEEAYGAREDTIWAVRDYAEQHGLHTINVEPKRRIVELEGPVESVERAFGTTLYDHEKDGKTFRGRQGPVLLPPEIAENVEAVMGLDNRPVARPRIRPRAAATRSYYPNELARLYSYPDGDGAGQTVALIELGGNYDTADLQTYFTAAGTPMPTVRTVSVTPGSPVPYGSDPESDGEVMLDIEVVGAIAPAATIVVYFAENSDDAFYQAASLAIHDPATTAVSISWGGAELYWSPQSMNAWETLAQAAAALKVSVFAASGDHGAPDQSPPGVDGQRHVDFPASVPHIFACGGTNIQTRNGRITSETVWNDNNGWATGGGISVQFPVPAWQKKLRADSSGPLAMRGVPDVAGDADPDSGINVRSDGEDGVSGGTSAVAPMWAALAALIAQSSDAKPGFFLPLLYANASTLNDVVHGNNTAYGVAGFNAQPGWDACTGLGTPIGTAIVALLSSQPAQPATT